MSEISLAAAAVVQQTAAKTPLIQPGTQEHRGQKKDAPVKGRQAEDALNGGVNGNHVSRCQGRCQYRLSLTREER